MAALEAACSVTRQSSLLSLVAELVGEVERLRTIRKAEQERCGDKLCPP